jgi:hypothetical protein
MQWLEQFGLMQTHWAQKWFQFEKEGKHCRLQGLQANTKQCQNISMAKLQQLQQQDSIHYVVQLCLVADEKGKLTVSHIIGMVLETYETVFEEPKGLPPQRKCDHKIPLLPGAAPVNLRPYRYSPFQKNEIEKQIKELLAQGVIRPSSSPFAFQTHHGHFEYLVMPYGVTGGPATFQSVMNEILAPFLRKFVLIFVDDILIYSKSLEEHARHLEAVLEILLQQDFKVKKSKCAFAK